VKIKELIDDVNRRTYIQYNGQKKTGKKDKLWITKHRKLKRCATWTTL